MKVVQTTWHDGKATDALLGTFILKEDWRFGLRLYAPDGKRINSADLPEGLAGSVLRMLMPEDSREDEYKQKGIVTEIFGVTCSNCHLIEKRWV